MVNIFFELDRMRITLRERGVDDRTINNVVAKARKDIEAVIEQEGEAAVQLAVEVGAQSRSAEFINELRLDMLNFEVDTESGRLDFSEPPRPMLPFLLKNAKPMKDGTGFYKVIPVGKPSDRPKISSSIIDTQKRITAERVEQAKARQKAMAPTGSVSFKVASSKQDPQTQWVQPATKKDFTEDVKALNKELSESIENKVYDIINGYLELF